LATEWGKKETSSWFFPIKKDLLVKYRSSCVRTEVDLEQVVCLLKDAPPRAAFNLPAACLPARLSNSERMPTFPPYNAICV